MNTNCYTTLRWLPCVALLVAQAALVSAYAADTKEMRGQLSSSDYKFAKEAACGGALEVSLGKLASTKSANPAVQQFGQRMVTDHTKAGQNLAQIVSAKEATVPSEPTASQQKELDRLDKLSGQDFDRAYMDLMVRDHKTDVREFKHASEHADDPELKTFAATTLPTLEDHLKMAEGLDRTLKHEVSMGR